MNRYRISIAAILFSSVFSAAGQDLPFNEPFPSLTLNESKSLANAGDLNGDGRDDFFSWMCDPAQIILIFSSGFGYTKTVLGSDITVAGVGWGDVNLDGIPDLIVSAPRSTQLEFRYGLGDGTFGEPFTIRYSRSVSSNCADGWSPVNIADIDGDGVEELVLFGMLQLPDRQYKRTAVIPLSPDGPGTRDDAVYGDTWPAGLGNARDIRLTDVDGDGDLDLVLLLTDDSQAYVCRFEDGVYAAPVPIQTPSTLGSVFANMNGDRMPDLLRADGNRFFVELLSPDGPSESITIDTGRSLGNYVNIGDVDQDGTDDFVIPQGSMRLHVVMTEVPSGSPKVNLLPFSGESSSYYSMEFLPSNSHPGSVNYLLYTGSSSGIISQVQSIHDGVTPLFRTVCLSNRGGMGAWMLDLGDPELNTLIEDSFGVMSYKFDTAGNITETVQLSTSGFDNYIPGDFNGDSLPDLAMILNGVEMILSDASGAMTMLPWTGMPYTPQAASFAIDIDQDGRDEIVIARNSSSTPGGYLFKAEGNQIVRSSIAISAPAVFGGAFDADGDGYPDLILSNLNRTVVVYNRDGAFDTEPVTLLEGFYARTMVGHDVDADGFDDLIVLNRSSGEVVIFWGKPGGISEPQTVSLGAGHGCSGISVFDADGDGLRDIVLMIESHSTFATPRILFQTGHRNFERIWGIESRYGKSVVRTDVNGDGVPDTILLRSNQGSTQGECGALLIFGLSGQTCAADLNADGVLDASDLSLLLSLYPAADPAIDLAEPFGVVNFSDIVAYLGAYNAGCP